MLQTIERRSRGRAIVVYPQLVDPVTDILRSLRLVSSIFSTAQLTAPWSIHTRGAPGAIFHGVVRGRLNFRLGRTGEPIEVKAGEIVLVSQGSPHTMGDEPDRYPVPITELNDAHHGQGIPCLVHGGEGDQTDIVCGAFRLDHGGSDMILRLLPEILHIKPSDTALMSWFDSTLGLMRAEAQSGRPGADAILARLADVLLVQMLRAGLDALPEENAGWLAALRDPQIGQALAVIHAEPAAKFSAGDLASQVGMSRSNFFDRFTKLVGEPPAQYLTRWKVQTAVDLLNRAELSNAEVAGRVGYRSEDAFGKVFKKHTGLTLGEYRARCIH